MLRPGRLDKMLYVTLPSAEERCKILKTLIRNTPVSEDLDLEIISKYKRLERFRYILLFHNFCSGADLAALVRAASLNAITPFIENNKENKIDNCGLDLRVSNSDFQSAMYQVSPSVSKEVLKLVYFRIWIIMIDSIDFLIQINRGSKLFFP